MATEQPTTTRSYQSYIMSFDLDSSSSSDINATIAPRQIIHEPASDDDSSDIDQQQAIGEELVQSIRNALHLSIGNICREQDVVANSDDADIDTDNMMGGDTQPSFTTTNAAIAALTDLTYHYSTTLLANDLVSFSSHAGRKIIKPEDVLLMCRKDKGGIGADMKLKMKEICGRNTNNKGNTTMTTTKKKAAKKSVSPPPPPRRKSNSDRSTSPVVRKKSAKAAGKTKGTKSKSKTSRKTPKAPQVYSSSSSDSDEDLLASVVQKAAEIERQKSAQKNRSDDLNDFIVDDNNYYNNNDDDSDDEVDFQLSAKKKKKSIKSTSKTKTSTAKKTKKNALYNSSARNQDVFGGLSDSDSSSDDVVSKPKYKSIDAHFSKRRDEGTTEDMAIDLGSD